MSQKYKRMVIILGLLVLFLMFMLYFYQAPFVHFWVTYFWYPFKAFILNPKTGWIAYGLIGPAVLIAGGVIVFKKWFK